MTQNGVGARMGTREVIRQFRGEHFYLSNMYPLERWIASDCGVLVPTSKHFYMSGRFCSPELQREVAYATSTGERVFDLGLAAKRLAYLHIENGAAQLEGWQLARIGVMARALSAKFDANYGIARALISTGDALLVEGNDWGDAFWGVNENGFGSGKNTLGILLMAEWTRQISRYQNA